jgi:DNA-binding response OmpR family regulator
MVVEDDNAILELIEMILKKLKYNILSASSPKEAIILAEGYKGKIDLLITDTVMPGMNGRELADELCKRETHLKVLFMSGYTANVIIHRGVLDEGINYIGKPFSLEAFAAKVKEVLET